jgi:signal transduction histidine kinase
VLQGGRLRLGVEDDGPGIPEADRAAVLRRGTRLDEAMPGTGLGLAIVRDLAALYRGSLDLARSELGGLRATLDLPAA